ncbi:MAG: InlB B-repeat-containing protein, partial [Thermoplasmata archaeon]
VGLSAGTFNAAAQSTTASLTFKKLVVATYLSIDAWTIPTSNPNQFWVGNVSVGAGVVPPTSTPVQVNYTLESLSGLSFGLTVQEQGLPSAMGWSYTVGEGTSNTTFGSVSSTNLLSLEAGTDYAVSAGFVSGQAGEGYEVVGVSYFVDTVNGTAYDNVSVNNIAVFNLTGATNVTFWYAQAWWITEIAGANGMVSPGSKWTLNASSLLISATPDVGYIFVGWSGFGPGATGAAQRHSASTVIHPTGAVTEIASFAPRPPPSWTLKVSANGIPLGQPYTVELGGTTYWGTGSFSITNLSTGMVSLGTPYIFDNSTAGVRYVPGAANSSLVLSGTQLDIDANGTLTVPYSTQYLLTVASTAGGTVTPAGSSWESSGGQVVLTAAPSTSGPVKYAFSGWNGTGFGARTSKSPQITVVVGGVVTETAQFSALPPPPPATYTLTVKESGLPTAAGWDLAVGTSGAAGVGSLLVAGLNGSYTLTVPVVYASAGVRYVPNGSTSSFTEPVQV